jgi:hypothetical protein
MSTSFSPLADSEWSPDWDCRIVGIYGDPDEDEDSGTVLTVRAESAEQAETRVITFLLNNYSDDFTGARAVNEDSVGDTYRVRTVMGKRR